MTGTMIDLHQLNTMLEHATPTAKSSTTMRPSRSRRPEQRH